MPACRMRRTGCASRAFGGICPERHSRSLMCASHPGNVDAATLQVAETRVESGAAVPIGEQTCTSPAHRTEKGAEPRSMVWEDENGSRQSQFRRGTAGPLTSE